MSWSELVVLALASAQGGALAVLLSRLIRARKRRAPAAPLDDGRAGTTVSVLVASLNEAARIGPCLEGLMRQGQPLLEAIVVDSRSTDGTRDLVLRASGRDPRIVLDTDPPPPSGWIGKVWALQHGLARARGDWVLGIDADVEPDAGMVAGAVAAAEDASLDVASFSPRFAGMTGPEQWLQPSMLLTLVYRYGASGVPARSPADVMANGQCFLARREVLQRHGGYEPARASWADDVTLARHLARRGVRVGFLDGSRLYRVRAYTGLRQMWSEWGRSFDLSDATSRARQRLDVTLILLVQGLPLPVVLAALAGAASGGAPPAAQALAATSAFLLAVRALMLLALRRSYEHRSIGYWLSPLSDPLAAARLLLSSLRRPTRWRGRAVALRP